MMQNLFDPAIFALAAAKAKPEPGPMDAYVVRSRLGGWRVWNPIRLRLTKRRWQNERNAQRWADDLNEALNADYRATMGLED
jgi:hypothetical protein